MDDRKEQKERVGARAENYIKDLIDRMILPVKEKNGKKIARKLLALSSAFFFARGPWLFSFYPFGIALLSSVDEDLPLVYIGCLIGALLANGAPSLPFILLYTALFAVRLRSIHVQKKIGKDRVLPSRESVGLRTALAVCGASVPGVYTCFAESFSLHSLFALLFGLAASGTLSFLYCGAFSGASAHYLHKKAAFAALFFSLVYSLSSLSLFGFSPDLPVAVFILLLVGRKTDVLSCGALGLILGAACGRENVVVLALLASVNALFMKYSRRLAPWFGVLAGFAWAFYDRGPSAFLYVLPDLFAGLACTLPISLWLEKKDAARVPGVQNPPDGARKQNDLPEKLRDLSRGAHSLSRALSDPAPEQIDRIVDTSVGKICRECPSDCFSNDDRRASLRLELKKRNNLDCESACFAELPLCSKRQLLCENVNLGYADLLCRTRQSDRVSTFADCFDGFSLLVADREKAAAEKDCENLAEKERFGEMLRAASLPCRSYSAKGMRRTSYTAEGIDESLLSGSAAELQKLFEKNGGRFSVPLLRASGNGCTLSFSACPAIRPVGAAASVPKNGETENGDSTVFFTFDDLYFAVLCDGTGSGHDASVVSSASCGFLRDLIFCGASPETSLRILNSYLLSMNRECPCTVDMLCVDLCSGSGAFYKCGACPSLVTRGDNTFKIDSPGIPAGAAKEIVCSPVTVRLKPGDRVILQSDGVSDEIESSPWLRDLLSDSLGTGADEIARGILRCADRRGAPDDDRTALVVDLLDA